MIGRRGFLGAVAALAACVRSASADSAGNAAPLMMRDPDVSAGRILLYPDGRVAGFAIGHVAPGQRVTMHVIENNAVFGDRRGVR